MLKLSDFDFDFPQELIAKRTAGKGKTKILRVHKEDPSQRYIIPSADIIEELNENDCLVVNNTKVIPARLFGHKSSGGKVEVLLVQPRPEFSGNCWEAWVKPGKSFKEGKEVFFGDIKCLTKEIFEDGARLIEFLCDETELKKLMLEHGKIPLPPYIDRESDASDKDDYQTIFAKYDGAVAAPTASLHFSEDMRAKAIAKGVKVAEVTLHVGPGTFQNVKVEHIIDHKMHSEKFDITQSNADIINQAKALGGRIISVGTTSTRVLETQTDENGIIHAGNGETNIFIYPGYQWKIVDGLLTNFHWPKSTLVMLVSSFMGKKDTLDCYKFAISQKLKLFSYGDGMLIM